MRFSLAVILTALAAPFQLGLATPLPHPAPLTGITSASKDAPVLSLSPRSGPIASRDDALPGSGRGGGYDNIPVGRYARGYDTDPMRRELPSFAAGRANMADRRGRAGAYINDRSTGPNQPSRRSGSNIVDRGTTPPTATEAFSLSNSSKPNLSLSAPDANAVGNVTPGEGAIPASVQPNPTFWVRDPEPDLRQDQG